MIRSMIAGLFAVTVLSAPSYAHEQESDQTSRWDMIAFEVTGRGAPIYHWQYSPEYGGHFMEVLEDRELPPGQHSYAIRTLPPDRQRYLVLEDIVGRIPDPAPDSEGCVNYLPDLAYGTIRLTKAATTIEIRWNSSCRDESYVAFIDLLKEADRMMTEWGKTQPIARTETLTE